MRVGWLMAGGVTLALLWLGPLPELARRAFFAHMTLHMGVVAVAAPALALGLVGGPWDPATRAPRLFSPIPASFVELLVVWAWHAPALHHVARHTPWGLALEQSLFLLTGAWLWISALGGPPGRRGSRRIAGVLGLLLTSMHMTLLGALLVLSPRRLFSHAVGALGLTALQDQHLGGAIMLLVGGIAYLAGGLWLVAGLVGGEGPTRQGEVQP